MGEGEHEFEPRSRVGTVFVALLSGDEKAAGAAAEQPPEEHDGEVLAAAIRLAVRSLFDEDTPPEAVAEFVAAMRRDVEVNPAVAEALVRTQLGEEGLLADFGPQDVSDATWSMLGYLCEHRIGREDSLELVELAEREALPAA
ncbi:hypothetical protein Dvina_20835 [Dactylosporangium vinaceum]|uniref:TerB family tellurite resistance protein n=1 Tax=Dactylosporangium vinaceum TaxID=53362 RepID=A0ABV5MS07_9ACTN|nr:hypothetical protein [Dactylosporangium vinaceum]UAC00291.1 hypothetical protein Dvina_20835 [Dactylosporangium vinaceum]